MNSWPSLKRPDSLPAMTRLWAGRLRTARAMLYLCAAQFAVHTVPFTRWRKTLGGKGRATSTGEREARTLAATVDWAAERLPFETKCLPRAMAFSWMLRRKAIAHSIVFAVRPPRLGDSPNALHAWVEVGRAKVIGDLPGPWVETLRLGSKNGLVQ